MIKIIEQTTAERNQEVIDNFNLIKPYLDEGYSYVEACVITGLATSKYCNRVRWFKDLREYGEEQGYLYEDYRKGKGILE